MNNTTITVASAVFLIVVAGLFGYTYYQRMQLEDDAATQPVEQTDERPDANEGPYSYIERIDAKHYFIDGTHTLVGEVTLPTPCDLLQHDVMVAESFPEQITINFSVLNNAETCAQVLTTQRFMVEVKASENATFSARFAGRAVELNLIPAPEGETPDEFELFYKG